ncbi:MAG TPA: serine/threonine protein kinase [Solirubrobacterales bacterium]|nr:serine/threonine protein kinase [Solirubrobacterales bacterium]
MAVEGAMRGGRSDEFAPGVIFAGYRIERVLGRGGMGVVYLATELGLERRVALKVIRNDIADDERFRERFRSESRTAASIEDPRVVTVYAAGERDGLAYVAMRYVSGVDLQRLTAARGPLSPERAAAVIEQVGEGLDAVHAAGLVHRDVKPANVIVAEDEPDREDPKAFLTDFGLARTVASTSGLTATGEVIGTVDYMAPEQIQAERVDARADVYALGGVLFFAITGAVPFSAGESSAKMWAHLNEPPPSASSRGSGRGVLDPVIRRAMAKDPGRRYPSAGDLGRAAVAAVQGEAVTQPEHVVGSGEAAPTAPTVQLTPLREPPTETLPKRARRGRPRRRGWRLAAVLILLVLAGLGATAFVGVPKLDESDAPPTEQSDQREPNGVTVPFLIGLPLDVAESELDALGLESDRIGGGLFGVLVPEDWEVCDTAPAPDEVVPPGSTVELRIDRPGSC